MRYLSLFSGIEAASVAWEPLGWEPVGFSEIEPFPSAVLAHRFPGVPNLGDITKITKQQVEDLGHVDVVVFGFPCQDLSVAGNRKGLKNETDGTHTRSGLFYDAVRIGKWCGARWLLAENVPGLLSSKGGRDFASVVGTMAGAEMSIPRDGWRNAGFALGPEGLVEWAVLDAQFFGVPQRRRRVFIVRDSGDWRDRPPLLLEPESLRGHPAPGREPGEGVAPTLAARTRGGGGLGTDFDCDGGLIPEIAMCLNAGAMRRIDGESETFILETVATFDSSYGKLQGCSGQDANHGHSHLVPEPYTLAIRGRGDGRNLEYRQDGTSNAILTPNGGRDGIGVGAIAFSCKDSGADATEEQSPTLRAMNHDGSHANAGGQVAIAFNHRQDPISASDNDQSVAIGMAVRRITSTEAERLQGFPDGWTRIPWRGKPAEACPDGPRYKAIGNSMAVPVMSWIGERIEAAQIPVDGLPPG